MSTIIKFAFRTVCGRPVRLVISIILIFVTLFLTSGFVFLNTFSYAETEKRLFFSDSEGMYHRDSKYFCYTYRRYGDITGVQSNIMIFPRDAVVGLEERLAEVPGGYGYAVCKQQEKAVTNPKWQSYYGVAMGYETGAYHLDSFFGCFDEEAMRKGEDGVYRLYDDEGNIAPFFQDADMICRAYQTFYRGSAFFVDGTEVSALDTFGYSVYGRLPEKANEVVIPQSIYNSFAAYGYCNAGDVERIDNVRGEAEEINSYDDIIGKTIKLGTGDNYEGVPIDATIVGVLTVDYEEHNWEYYMHKLEEKYIASGNIFIKVAYPLFFDIIVSREYYETYRQIENYKYSVGSDDYYADLVVVSRDVEQSIAEEYFDIAVSWYEGMSYAEMHSYSRDNTHIGYYVGMSADSSLSGFYSLAGIMLDAFEPYYPFVYVLLPFCFLLTGFLFYSTIERKRRQIGIFRSLGARQRDISLSFLIALAAVALFCSILVLFAVQFGLLNYLNARFTNFGQTNQYIIEALGAVFTPRADVVLFIFGYPLLIALAVTALITVRQRSTTIISQLSPIAKKAGRKGK